MNQRQGRAGIGSVTRLLAASVALSGALSASAGLYDSWGYHASIQFNGYGRTEPLTNFPSLVILSNNCFSGFAYSQLLSGSNDLAFTDATGTMNLNYEIEQWNANGASYVWVQVPALTNNAAILAWWGAAGQMTPACTTNGATWTNGYVAVWHLGQSLRDSTANGNNGTDHSSILTNGLVGSARYFNGSSSYVDFGSASSLQFTNFTAETWVRTTAAGAWYSNILGNFGAGGSSSAFWGLGWQGSSQLGFVVRVGGSTLNLYAPSGYTDGQWHYLVGVDAAGVCACYGDNGNVGQTGTKAGIPYTAGASTLAGRHNTTYSQGSYRELRISGVPRSTNWIWACYANIASNSAFQSYGIASAGGGSATAANADPTNVVSGAACFNGTIAATGASPVTAVAVYWGPADGGTNATLWANTNALAGSVWNTGDIVTTNITGLAAGQDYFYTYGVVNAAGNNLALPSKYLIQGALTLAASDASCGSTVSDTATVTVTRPSTCTNGALTVWYTTAGAATNGVNYAASPASGSLTIPAGATSAAITITPQSPYNLGAARTFTFTLTNGSYLIGSANTATCTLQTLTGSAYTWSGSGANNNWSNPTNWGQAVNYPGIAGSAADTANFNDTATPTNVNFDAAQTLGTLNVTGTKNWSWSGSTCTENVGLNYGSTGTGSFNAVIAGPGGVSVTAGVLTNNNAANTYTGTTQVKGGVLDTIGTLGMGVASAAGNSTSPILLGDPATGALAELRLPSGGTHSRDITVQGGVGTSVLRARGGDTYTGTLSLSNDVVLAAGMPTDAAGTLHSFNGKITGTGSVMKVGPQTLALGNTANDYAGRTILNEGTVYIPNSTPITATNGIFGCPSSGNEEIWIGDTNGSKDVTLSDNNNTVVVNRPLRIRAGSTGAAWLSFPNWGSTPTLNGALTLEKSVTFMYSHGNCSINGPISMSGSGLAAFNVAIWPSYAYTVTYANNAMPNHNGGTRVYNSGTVLEWQYTEGAGSNVTLRFGNDTNGAPGAITLDNGTFSLYSSIVSGMAQVTLENPVIVTTNGGAFGWRFTGGNNTSTNLFTGSILLGGSLSVGDRYGSAGSYGRYTGAITLDQTVAGRHGLAISRSSYNACTIEGSIVDGAGSAANSLLLRSTSVAPTPAFTGTGCTYAYGTVVEGDVTGLVDVKSASGSLGLGSFWLLEGGRIRFSQAGQINTAGGATVTLYGNQAALSVLALNADFCPTFTADSLGVLAVETNGYDAVSSLAALGARTFLGSINGGAFTGASLAPAADGVYRLGGGGGTLTINNGVLAGAGNSLQVGHPCAGNSLFTATTAGNGGGTVKLLAASSYGGGSVVNANSTLEGQAQSSGTPFGSTTAGLTLSGGTLQLDGTNVANTTAIGTLTLNGSGTVTLNQPTFTATNTLAIDHLSTRSGAAPWVAVLNGTAATRLGSRERVVIVNNAPAMVNGMVAPYFITAYNSSPDFLAYNTSADAAGVIGFTNAAGAYSGVGVAGSLEGLAATVIANVTNNYTMTGPASVYALRVNNVNVTNTAGLQTLTLGSGGLILTGGLVSNNVAFGAEGNVYVGGNNATLAGNLSGGNGLTKSGPKQLTVSGVNTGLSGTIAVVQGILAITADANLGNATNPIDLDAGELYCGANWTNNRALYLGIAGGTLDTKGTVVQGGAVTGPGLLTKIDASAALTLTNANNTYAGGTLVYVNTSGGLCTLNVASNATLGVGDVTVAGTLNCYGDRNIGGGDYYGNNTTNRLARLSIEDGGTVYFWSAAPSIGSLSGSGSLYLSNTVLTVGGDNSSTIYAGTILPAAAGVTGSIVKVGSGKLTFKGQNSCPGTITVNGGTFVAEGAIGGSVTVNNGATLAGAGAVGAVTLLPGSILSPGSTVTNGASTNRATTLAAGSLTFGSGSVVAITINGPTNYTRIVASGPVNLGGATLQIAVNSMYKPSPDDVFYIILNSSTGATTSAFAGMAEGRFVDLGNGYGGRISYTGTGDATIGNDVKLYSVTRGVPGTVLIVQ